MEVWLVVFILCMIINLRVSPVPKGSPTSWNKSSRRLKEEEKGGKEEWRKEKKKRERKNEMKGIRGYLEVPPPFLL